MLPVNVGAFQNLGDGLLVGLLVWLIEAFKFQFESVRGTAKTCATGVPFGSTPEKSGSARSPEN